MEIRKKLKKFLENLTGAHIYRWMPRGFDIFYDIRKSFPKYSFDIIFDVGANVGQSAKSYLENYPYSNIYCFEPIAETFRKLEFNVKEYKQVHCYQIALGAIKGKGKMILDEEFSTMSHLLGESSTSANDSHLPTEKVDILTLDEFCEANNIKHISYLKVDTEGGDLDVLKGAETLFKEKSIDFVEVEGGMNPQNKHHVPFEQLKEYLEQYGYYIFGIYEQVNEWPTNEPHLRRTNSIYISSSIISSQ